MEERDGFIFTGHEEITFENNFILQGEWTDEAKQRYREWWLKLDTDGKQFHPREPWN